MSYSKHDTRLPQIQPKAFIGKNQDTQLSLGQTKSRVAQKQGLPSLSGGAEKTNNKNVSNRYADKETISYINQNKIYWQKKLIIALLSKYIEEIGSKKEKEIPLIKLQNDLYSINNVYFSKINAYNVKTAVDKIITERSAPLDLRSTLLFSPYAQENTQKNAAKTIDMNKFANSLKALKLQIDKNGIQGNEDKKITTNKQRLEELETQLKKDQDAIAEKKKLKKGEATPPPKNFNIRTSVIKNK